MQPALSSPRLLVVGILLSLALIVVQRLLPERRLDLSDAQAGNFHYLLDSGEPETAGSVTWVDESKRHLQCHYTRTARWQACGMGFSLVKEDSTRGLDLSAFSSIELKMRFKGPSTLVRLGIRNFDPRFSKADDTNSPRPHYVNLRVQDLGEPLRIDLNEFTVPEWWIMQMKHPREYNRARLDNAIQIAVDVPDDLTNKTYEMEIEHLVLHGEWVSREQTYLAILVAWLLGASLLSMHRSVQLRQRSRSQQREIDALMTRTRELRVAQDELRRLAAVDELTGVLNRRGIEQVMSELENEDEGITIVIADIDHFKQVNDRHGHGKGDEVLSRFAALLATNVRGSDVVGRWGGEEFVILCRGHKLDEASALAEKLRDRVARFDFDARLSLNITASFGVAVALPGHTADEAFKRADKALYRAKSEGRNRVESASGSEPVSTFL